MKLQLTINEHPMDGYEVLDPFTNENFEGDYLAGIQSYKQGEITEIYAPQLIDYIGLEGIKELLKIIFTYLRKGCKIILGGTELYILTKKLINRQIYPEHYNSMVFNRKVRVKNLIPMIDMKSIMMEAGFEIDEININNEGCSYTIVGKRK